MKPKAKKVKAKVQPAKGPVLEPNDTNDILPADMILWEKMERLAFAAADYYNFSQIETPILERMDLFSAAKIEKNEDDDARPLLVRSRSRNNLILRTDLRIPTMRSYIVNGFNKLPQPQRLFYLGPVFKEDRNGRPKEFHELGFEIIGGTTDSIFDVQVINLAYKCLEDLRIKNLMVKLNSSGCLVCRPNYRKKLVNYYRPLEVCRLCRTKLDKDPIGVFACKEKKCEELRVDAPSILDSLCGNCNSHFKHTLEFLEEVARPYMLDSRIIASAEYYDKTIFEIVAEVEDGESVKLAAGGRYDYLAEAMGGHNTPAVGVTIPLRPLFDFVKSRATMNMKVKNKVFLVYVGDLAKRKSLSLIEEFSRHNVPVMESLGKDSLATQLEFALRVGSPLGLIFGQREAYEETVIVRDMKTGVQETIPLRKIVEEVKKRLKEY